MELGELPDQHHPDARSLGVDARRAGLRGDDRGFGLVAEGAGAEDDRIPLPRHREPQAAPRRGGAGDLAEQPGEHLLEPRRVGDDRQLARRGGDGQPEVAVVERRPDRRRRGAGGRGGVEPLFLQLDPLAGEPGEVQQVVELPDQGADLPLHGIAGPGQILRGRRPPDQVQGTADGGGRVAQVVGHAVEHRVPGADLLAEVLERGAAVVEDVDDHRLRLDAAGAVPHRDPLDPTRPPCPAAPPR